MKNSFKTPAFTLLLFLAFASIAWAQSIISEDFTGSKNWGFDSITDPSTQIGGNDQFEYTMAATNNTAFLDVAINGSGVFASETGQVELSYQLDINNWTSGSSDFSTSEVVSVLTSGGNKDDFTVNQGTLFEQGFSGFNNPGDIRVGSSAAIVFDAGGNDKTSSFTTPDVFNATNTITVSGDDATGWTIDYTTDVTDLSDNPIGSISNSFRIPTRGLTVCKASPV